MNELNIYLQDKIKELNVSKNSGYEKEACINLGFNYQTKRYWDCEYNGLYIEIKKENLRYCEIFMGDKRNHNYVLNTIKR